MTSKHTTARKASGALLGDNRKVIATLLTEYERPHFMPNLFGMNLMMQGEALVFDLHSHMTGLSRSGYWNLYKLTNGGLYMAPEGSEPLRVTWPYNGFDDMLSTDALGIVITMFATSIMACELDSPRLSSMVGKLDEFAMTHPERNKIRAALD